MLASFSLDLYFSWPFGVKMAGIWDEYACDPQAKTIAEGGIDRLKQNALYVDVGKTGQVSSTPFGITEKEANVEFEKTKILKEIFHRKGDDVHPLETLAFMKVSDAFKTLFGIITNEEYNKRW